MSRDKCNIIIPVYNNLSYITSCLDSVIKFTDYPYDLIIINDGSDFYVRDKLGKYRDKYSNIRVFSNERNLGFVKSVNEGIKVSSEKYIVVLNSDTYVTPGWLSRIVKCAESDPKIAVVNPITNMAANLSVQIPPGLNIFSTARRISEITKKKYPDIITAVGFCFLLKREIVDKFGGFDEIYGMGYCEESDYCMRLIQAGYRVVAADNAFVYHKGAASFDKSLERYLTNRKIFDKRWGEAYLREYTKFMKENPLNYIRNQLYKDLILIKPDLNTFRNLWYMTKDVFNRKGIIGIIRKIPKAAIRILSTSKNIGKDFGSKNNKIENPLKRQFCWVTPKYITNLPKGEGMKVAFLIYQMGMSGGILQVTYLINQLIKEGHTAYILTLAEDPEPGAFNLYTRPMRFKNLKEMVRCFPNVDLVVATFWPTACFWLPKIKNKNLHFIYLYFIQDVESRFYPDNIEIQRRIHQSYNQADYRVVTTQWIKNELDKIGYTSYKIPYGIDLNVFYPRDRKGKNQFRRIILQARPKDFQRGFVQALEVFKVVSQRRKDIEFVFYGCNEDNLKTYDIPFRYINEGILYDSNKVAELFCTCDLFFDPSLFQGFGLPGLEAMACGIPTVLTKEGGITEYAVNETNSILIDPQNIGQMVEAILNVLENTNLINKLIEKGLETAQRFSAEKKMSEHINFYKEILMKKENIKRFISNTE